MKNFVFISPHFPDHFYKFVVALNRANKLCEEATLGYMNMCKRVEVLEKCLDEIKGMVKDLKNECFYEDFECADCDMTFACNYHKKYEILRKIKEVKGDK